MRVIPDVDANAERSEKQKEENSKFGFLSNMLNQNIKYLKIGYPNVYQPLNYAIKKNISLVSKTENGFEFDFSKAAFSEGKLAPCSPNASQKLSCFNTATNPFSLRYDFLNDYPNEQQADNDSIICILYFSDSKELYLFYSFTLRGTFKTPPRCYVRNLNEFSNRIASCSLFFFNKKNKNPFKSSKTIYFGNILLGW